LCPSVSRLHEITRDVHTDHRGSEASRRKRRRAIAASEVEHGQARSQTKRLDERCAAIAHGRRNAREVPFFPECLIRIHRLLLVLLLRWNSIPANSRVSRRCVTPMRC
jgi:hypothetical protein